MTIVYEYIGDGAFVVDDLPVPARNITSEDLTPELVAVIEANIAGPCCVYRKIEKVKKQPSKAEQEG